LLSQDFLQRLETDARHAEPGAHRESILRNFVATDVRQFGNWETAIKKGDVISLRHALEAGMTPDLSNQFSWTLLMIAALEGNTSIGSLLIDSGAELDRRNKFNDTALSFACHSGHPSFVELLLTRGASLD
jgi:ankyrin repeat protein